MKYLKNFEYNKIPEYNIGDYILIDVDKVIANNKTDGYELDIIDKYGLISYEPTEFDDKFLYSVAFYNYKDELYGIFSDEIIRKMNKDEIDEYNNKKDALKFNI